VIEHLAGEHELIRVGSAHEFPERRVHRGRRADGGTGEHVREQRPGVARQLLRVARNGRRQLRGLAAAQLATMKALDTLPDILRAAEDEKDPFTQANIAAAATWMDSPKGMSILRDICLDSGRPPYVRQNAARNLFDKGDHSCFYAMLELMQPNTDVDSRIGSAYMLSQLRDKTEEESKHILPLLLASLNDPEIRIRLTACNALRSLNNPVAIEPLRTSLSYEREDTVRQQIQSTLNFLIKSSTPH